jgi:uncharacterized protein HemX
MTVGEWNLVLNATIGVLVLGYGLWLRNVIEQQLKSKDTAIQALEAGLKSKEAEISVLKTDTAPAITEAYKKMREHANQMTEESARLGEQLKQSKATTQTSPIRLLLAEADGLLAAGRLVEEKLGKVMFPATTAEFSLETVKAYLNGFNDSINGINAAIKARTDQVRKMMAAIPGM